MGCCCLAKCWSKDPVQQPAEAGFNADCLLMIDRGSPHNRPFHRAPECMAQKCAVGMAMEQAVGGQGPSAIRIDDHEVGVGAGLDHPLAGIQPQ